MTAAVAVEGGPHLTSIGTSWSCSWPRSQTVNLSLSPGSSRSSTPQSSRVIEHFLACHQLLQHSPLDSATAECTCHSYPLRGSPATTATKIQLNSIKYNTITYPSLTHLHALLWPTQQRGLLPDKVHAILNQFALLQH